MDNNRIYKIAVVMSTYNGEKFIAEQLDSILNQNVSYNISLKILVRDDCSADRTLEIISKYLEKDSRVEIIGNSSVNLGVKASFFELLKHAVNYDLVFFSDQDDVWEKDKINTFLNEAIKKNVIDSELPIGIYSDAWIADEKAHSIGEKMSSRYDWNEEKADYKFLSFNYQIVGATYAINKASVLLANVVPNSWIDSLNMHDSFIGLINAVYGRNYLIDEPLVFYRQHGNNLVGAGGKRKSINKKITQAVDTIYQLIHDDLMIYKFLNIHGPQLLSQNEYIERVSFFKQYVILAREKHSKKSEIISKIKPYVWKKHYIFAILMLNLLNFKSKEQMEWDMF